MTTLETDDDLSSGDATTFNGTTPTKSPTAQYTYTFDGWATEANGAKVYNNGSTPAVSADVTYYAHFAANLRSYTIRFLNGETVLQSSSIAYGTTPSYAGTPTKTANDEYTYAFTGWSPTVHAVNGAQDYTAIFSQTKKKYTLTWDMAGGATATADEDYTHGLIDWGTTIVVPAAPTKDGFTFAGWSTTPVSEMPTHDVTYTAQWEAGSMSELELLDMEEPTHYNAFQDYDGVTVGEVTYVRTFTANRWSTLCLPFFVSNGNLISNTLVRQVFEFRHASGENVEGGSFDLHFASVNEMVAGRGYLVRTQANKTVLRFSEVTIDTEADTETDITNLTGTSDGIGTITLVGTLRKGTLPANDKHYLGLLNNKLYYPGVNTTVSAYRGYFKDSNPSLANRRARIIVDGEYMGELMIDNGELLDAGGDDRAPRKYISNGELVIERNGERYNAQGSKM